MLKKASSEGKVECLGNETKAKVTGFGMVAETVPVVAAAHTTEMVECVDLFVIAGTGLLTDNLMFERIRDIREDLERG